MDYPLHLDASHAGLSVHITVGCLTTRDQSVVAGRALETARLVLSTADM